LDCNPNLSFLKTSDASTANTATRPDERRAEVAQLVLDHAALRDAVSSAQTEFEAHDKVLRDRYLNPARTADLGVEDNVEEQRRQSLRFGLGEAQLALAEFERTHDMKAGEAELAGIVANVDARERAVAAKAQESANWEPADWMAVGR
jgi:hypothetical protein